MTFRVIKFCKHSPGGLTVISNLFYCSFPSFLYPLPISLHISFTYLPTFPFALPASSIYQPFICMPLFALAFSAFSLFFCLSGPFLLGYHLSLWSPLICFSRANSDVWGCSSLVDFCYIKPSPALTDFSLDSSLSSLCPLLLYFMQLHQQSPPRLSSRSLVNIHHHLRAPISVVSPRCLGKFTNSSSTLCSLHSNTDAEGVTLVDRMCP